MGESLPTTSGRGGADKYTDTTATLSLRYCWRGRATNSAGDSGYSNTARDGPHILSDNVEVTP